MTVVLNVLGILLFDTTAWHGILLAVLLIVGYWGMFKKSGVDPRWALVPCVRDYMFSKCAGREPEGRVLFITNVFALVLDLTLTTVEVNFENGQASNLALAISALVFVLMIVKLVYHIRICSGIIQMYHARGWWMWLWLFITGLPAVIWGFNPKYQPEIQAEDLTRISLDSISGVSVAGMKDGLTVNLEERTAKEFFQKKYLLRDIHMYIKPGHMVLLLGGSGAGKTTFLNAVNGYEKAKAKVTLNGGDIYAEYKKMQYEIGFVPQQELMRGKDTVYRTLTDASRMRLPRDISRKDRKARVDEVMRIFGLTPVRGNLVEKLSGGQKKRLSIALEFISNPSLFILDEPDSGLDGVMARELM